MNDHTPLEELRHKALTPKQLHRLFGMVDAILKSAIDARTPKKRPPGKAGLRAEKSYYRLLYVEGDFHEKVNIYKNVDPDAPPYDWAHLIELLRQLTDIPELQAEIQTAIEAALEEVTCIGKHTFSKGDGPAAVN